MWIFIKNSKKLFFDEKFGLGAKYGSGEETDYIFNHLNRKKVVFYSSKASISHPEEFSDQKTSNNIYKKFYSYGTGQGALLRKNIDAVSLLTYYLIIVSLFKSCVGIVVYLTLFKINNVIKYYALLKGKIFGLINYN